MADIFSLAGRVALVTGGGGGLGRVFCETLARCGARVSLLDLESEGAQATAELVRGLGAEVLALQGDVNNEDDVTRMAAATEERFGGIDILVNNAGVSVRPARIADTTIHDWDRAVGVNLRGVFLCARACLPIMVERGKGNVINVASVLGVRPFPQLGREANFPYGVTKAGVIRLTKEIAFQYARDGIRANCIAPGWHRGTRLSGRSDNEAGAAEERRRYEQEILRMTPMARRGEPAELAGLLIYLASDASSFMTGQVLISDGGACL